MPSTTPAKILRNFLFPALSKSFFIRLIILSLSCYLIFSYVLIPLRIQGHSMEPTYKNGSYAFCWRLKYLYTQVEQFDIVTVRFAGKSTMLLKRVLEQFDIVTVRFAGKSTMLLKRVLALPGDTLEFREGLLYINDKQVDEPYIKYHSPWSLSPRLIKPGYAYVVGDNRGTDMSRHHFGQVNMDRIIGSVVL